MEITTRITKWGNSQAIRLPKDVLAKANLQLNDTMGISCSDGKILLKRVEEKRLPVYRPLEEIFADAKMPGPWEEEEIDWGRPVGAENE